MVSDLAKFEQTNVIVIPVLHFQEYNQYKRYLLNTIRVVKKKKCYF